MEIDCYFPDGLPLGEAAAAARAVAEAGFAGMWVTETRHNPYLTCGAALAAAVRIEAGPGIAVAFPRSPMVTAQAAWDLADMSGGRFVLGLGTQVKAHIERRFAVPFDRPVARMREYVHAVRAIFAAFQGGGRLRFAGDFYQFSLLTDFFNPGGVFLHPLHSAEYLRATALPAVAAGARAAGREREAVTVCCPVFVAVGETQAEIDRQRAGIARQIAFYGSTRTYRPVFDAHGWGDVCDRLHELLARGDTAAMAALITGEMLDSYSVAATWEELPGVLARRYGGLVDRIAPYGADLGSASGQERWRAVVTAARNNKMI
jgi:alkanesulfonate monooxygenase SsuD/methylene tetrahydromethanopterin reductase-like flavin-dependent oxidoreductase (luciferase family)